MENQTLKKLSKEMKISTRDILSFARSVVNSIVQDKVVSQYINGSDAIKMNFLMAYIDHDAKKMRSFTTKYLTNSEARECFQSHVFNLIKASK